MLKVKPSITEKLAKIFLDFKTFRVSDVNTYVYMYFNCFSFHSGGKRIEFEETAIRCKPFHLSFHPPHDKPRHIHWLHVSLYTYLYFFIIFTQP